jgi:hypothetical protein
MATISFIELGNSRSQYTYVSTIEYLREETTERLKKEWQQFHS